MPMQGIYRCPFRSIWHFKNSYSRCNYSCFSTPKTPLFFYFPFCCKGKFLAICLWWWCFIVDRNELKYFLKRSLQSTFISVIIIHRNVHVYFYTCTHLYFNILIITWKRKLARKEFCIEEFRHSNRRFMKGCIILYIVRIFSSSELVEPHIIPLKVRLAVALKEEAKWQVFVRDCEHWILLLYRILILYWAYTCNSVIKSRKPIKGLV